MTFDDLKKELLKNVNLFDKNELNKLLRFKKPIVSVEEIINCLDDVPIKIIYYFMDKMSMKMDIIFSDKEKEI